ncbi:MAG: type II toxin-antitoxin system RelE/ParE family toxin [Chitinophagaceae bacterium]|nr:MAG: type II toxin-antitoxin system RelE/ParE family toxin [Chitinophagaceae bacterium]
MKSKETSFFFNPQDAFSDENSRCEIGYELLTSSFGEIVQNPALGKNYNEIDNVILGLRVGKHIVFYREVQAGDIEILRILHQRMDLKNKIVE